MDEIVAAALAKWPRVPHCRGWLALDARGDWYLRDEGAQRAGPFPRVKGSRIEHDRLIGFIHRNYAADAEGAWFFQNGPQRVYVELEAAPFVWRVDDGAAVHAHTGAAATPHGAWLDEQGRLFLATELGLGIVHTLDMARAAEAVERGQWQPRAMPFARMPEHFGYRLRPAPPTPSGAAAASYAASHSTR